MHAHGALLPGVDPERLLEDDLPGTDHAPEHALHRLVRMVAELGLERHDALALRGDFRPYPRIDDRNAARGLEPHVVRDAVQQAGDIGHPVPSGARNIGRTGMVGDRRLRGTDQHGQHVLPPVAAEQLRHLEPPAVHESVETAQPFAVEIDLGTAVRPLEAEPAVPAHRKLLGSQFGPIPEIPVVFLPVRPVGVVAEVRVGLDSRLDIGGEHGSGDDGRNPLRHVVSGLHHGPCVAHLVLGQQPPAGHPAVAVERRPLHGGRQTESRRQHRRDQYDSFHSFGCIFRFRLRPGPHVRTAKPFVPGNRFNDSRISENPATAM